MDNEPILVERTARISQGFLYNNRDQLQGSVIVAGFDEQENGQVNYFRLFEKLFALYFF